MPLSGGDAFLRHEEDPEFRQATSRHVRRRRRRSAEEPGKWRGFAADYSVAAR